MSLYVSRRTVSVNLYIFPLTGSFPMVSFLPQVGLSLVFVIYESANPHTGMSTFKSWSFARVCCQSDYLLSLGLLCNCSCWSNTFVKFLIVSSRSIDILYFLSRSCVGTPTRYYSLSKYAAISGGSHLPWNRDYANRRSNLLRKHNCYQRQVRAF